ncbi:MAG: NAD(P)-dependent oxidoreductase [Thermoprotei archaeon]|jgi:3-hydroxyisobutyrate dehydrogenase
MNVGLIGLGVMGWRIGANLVKANSLNIVYNRTLNKAENFSKIYGISYARSLEEISKNSDFIITMLSDDTAVSSVVNQILPYLKGKILVDMSTISPSISIELAKKVMENDGIMFDAPVIGTSIMVEQKKIVVLVGGPNEYFNTIKGILQHTSSSIIYIGENGMGLYAKLVNNLLLGSYIAAIAEAYNFGIKSGLDPNIIAKILTELSSARSPTSELKVPKILFTDYSTQFATKHMRKDLEIVQKEAQRIKAITPMSAIALQLYKMTEGLGLSESDFVSIFEIFRRLSPT